MMRMPLLALAGLCLAACAPESDKTNPAVATDESVAAREAMAPATGANSFTEDQARERITTAGYADVSGLALGQDGVWRGMANVAGQSQQVMLDYQGNITTSAQPAPADMTMTPSTTTPSTTMPPADATTPMEPKP